MTSIVFMTVGILLLLICLKAFGVDLGYFKQAFYRGVSLWASWLPMIAIIVFVFIVGINLSRDDFFMHPYFSLSGLIGNTELLVFFVITPLFFTRFGNLVACALCFYSVERLAFSETAPGSTLGVLLIIASTITVTVLGDKMPWLSSERANDLAHRLREILVVVLSFAASAAIIAAILNTPSLGIWLKRYFGLNIPAAMIFIGLLALFSAWVSIALGVTRHFSLPLICLPSLVIVSFVTQWPPYLLVIPFTLSLALALGVVDQRLVTRFRKA